MRLNAAPGMSVVSVHVNDRDNPDLCGPCGGLCCAIYLAHDEDGAYIGDGWLPAQIAEWTERFIGSGAARLAENGTMTAGPAGIEPLHDPRLSHLPTPEGESYRASLPSWVDVRKCQFCHPDSGCMLPREHRAPICGEWVCELWRAAESTEVKAGSEGAEGQVATRS